MDDALAPLGRAEMGDRAEIPSRTGLPSRTKSLSRTKSPSRTETLALAHTRSRPVTTADARLLQVPGALGGCFPEGAIRRGSTLVIQSTSGGVSLALALAAAITAEELWVAAVGLPTLGLLAAAELGVKLERLALVPTPGDRWPAAAAALLDGMDLLLLGPPGRVRSGDARRLAARAREQGTVLVVLEPPGTRRWPEAPDLRLSIASATWVGLGCGYGYLGSRRVEVVTIGRRAAAQERRTVLWLPAPVGSSGHQPHPAAGRASPVVGPERPGLPELPERPELERPELERPELERPELTMVEPDRALVARELVG
jgi:hypothetical protein